MRRIQFDTVVDDVLNWWKYNELKMKSLLFFDGLKDKILLGLM